MTLSPKRLAYQKEWAARNREKTREYKRRWRESNPEKMECARANWREKNGDRILAKRRIRTLRLTGRVVIPRSSVSAETKKEKARASKKRWYESHKHELKTRNKPLRKRTLSAEAWKRRLEYQKKWRAANLEKQRGYDKKYRASRPSRMLKHRLCARVNSALRRKNLTKGAKISHLIGCTWAFLKEHIEKQFITGMSWENRGQWHIDHIRPCASFDLSNVEQQKACFHFTNLQPLWGQENMSKGSKWQEAA